MKILFLFSLDDILSISKPLRNQDQIQFGISYLSAVLKKAGHQTELVICSEISGKKNLEMIKAKVLGFQPDLIAFTAVATEYDFVLSLASAIKRQWPDIYRIIGGPHTTLNPAAVIESQAFDAICLGEGEYPMLELVDTLARGGDPTGIKNLWFNRTGKIEKNPTRDFLADLDELPFPDREIWQPWLEEQAGSRQAVILGRGCPFDCTYCCNHALRKVAQGKYYRLRSPENIVAELKYLTETYPGNGEVYLEIETIGIDMDWSLRLCAQIAAFNRSLSKPLSYGINLRITPKQKLDELFAAFKEANFRFVNIGLESGSNRVRQEVLKRYYSNDDVYKAVTVARKFGIKVAFFNMIGLPGETKAEFWETIEVNRRCQPDWHFTSIFFPYPGTELYQVCQQKGFLNKKIDTRQERSQATLSMPGFSKREIQRRYIWFDYLVYRGQRPLGKILYEVATKELRSHFYLKHYLAIALNKVPYLARLKQALRKKLVGEAYLLSDNIK